MLPILLNFLLLLPLTLAAPATASATAHSPLAAPTPTPTPTPTLQTLEARCDSPPCGGGVHESALQAATVTSTIVQVTEVPCYITEYGDYDAELAHRSPSASFVGFGLFS